VAMPTEKEATRSRFDGNLIFYMQDYWKFIAELGSCS